MYINIYKYYCHNLSRDLRTNEQTVYQEWCIIDILQMKNRTYIMKLKNSEIYLRYGTRVIFNKLNLSIKKSGKIKI